VPPKRPDPRTLKPLHARSEWPDISLHLFAHALTWYSDLDDADDLVGRAYLKLSEAGGKDPLRTLSVDALVNDMKRAIDDLVSLDLKSYRVRMASASYGDIEERRGDPNAPDVEALVSMKEEEERARKLNDAVRLALGNDRCATLLIDGLDQDLEDPRELAMAAGFDLMDIKNAKRRIHRAGLAVARGESYVNEEGAESR
jgi:hypothetical protein